MSRKSSPETFAAICLFDGITIPFKATPKKSTNLWVVINDKD